jgi:NosR/NirI family nitrous oxide reductase transcriptional regulator
MKTLFLVVILINACFSTVSFADDNQLPNVIVASTWQDIFPNGTSLGDKDTSIPVWPVYQVGSLIGYIFESIDFIQMPGFSGEPINLLVGIDTQGNFIGVRVLAHNEPIFLHGLGEEPLFDFVKQYKQLSAVDVIKVGRGKSNAITYIDGISKATISVVVINETILLAALHVAREKLEGFESTSTAVARVKDDLFSVLSWQDLLDKGYLQQVKVSNKMVQESFVGTSAEYLTNDLVGRDNDIFTHLSFAYLNVPTVGKNILGDSDYQRLQRELKEGEQAILVMSKGHYSFIGDDFIPASIPDKLTLEQNGLPVEIRDMNFYDGEPINSPYLSAFSHYKIFRINPKALFDPALEWDLSLLVNRSRGQFFQVTTREFSKKYTLPKTFFEYPAVKESHYTPPWLIIWESRIFDIVILVISLMLLTAVVLFQHKITKKVKLFRWVRGGFLLFTLVFIGWYAQGQLSVVNIFTLFKSIIHQFRIEDFLLDPILFILWSYVFLSLFLWGRGVFCGWLCPFGALQEIVSWLAKWLNIKQFLIKQSDHERLWLIKYVVLMGLVTTSFFSLYWAEVMSEIEPFKTAITLIFVRSWPFLIYAFFILGFGLFVHKFYCRYICPLGAGLAIVGFFHRFEWLKRRKECGTPCQLCKNECEINAIKPSGSIDYNECIQCFECIVYHNSEDLCAPQVIANKKLKKENRSQDIICSYP